MKQFILIFVALFLSCVSFATPLPITGSTTVCAGDTATLSDATPGGTWSSSAPAIAAVGSLTGVVTGISAGTAIITYTTGGSYVIDTITIMPVVIPSVSIVSSPALPVAPGTIVRLTAIPVNGGSAPAYQWFVNGVVSAAPVDTFIYNPTYGDIVTVCLHASAMCATPVMVCSSDTIPATTGIHSVNGTYGNIYPNPVENELTIRYDFTGNEDGVLQITDITGHVIVTQVLNAQKQKEVLDMSNLPAGMYLYRLKQGNAVISTGKLIKS